jgi:hypothetical protein
VPPGGTPAALSPAGGGLASDSSPLSRGPHLPYRWTRREGGSLAHSCVYRFWLPMGGKNCVSFSALLRDVGRCLPAGFPARYRFGFFPRGMRLLSMRGVFGSVKRCCPVIIPTGETGCSTFPPEPTSTPEQRRLRCQGQPKQRRSGGCSS